MGWGLLHYTWGGGAAALPDTRPALSSGRHVAEPCATSCCAVPWLQARQEEIRRKRMDQKRSGGAGNQPKELMRMGMGNETKAKKH